MRTILVRLSSVVRASDHLSLTRDSIRYHLALHVDIGDHVQTKSCARSDHATSTVLQAHACSEKQKTNVLSTVVAFASSTILFGNRHWLGSGSAGVRKITVHNNHHSDLYPMTVAVRPSSSRKLFLMLHRKLRSL